MSKKPWRETWEAVHEGGISQVGCDGVVIVDIVERNFCSELDFGERAPLIAAAPALVRALLAVEWSRFGHECQPCQHHRVTGHGPSCPVDAALTSAGLPTQKERDEARAEMTKETDNG